MNYNFLKNYNKFFKTSKFLQNGISNSPKVRPGNSNTVTALKMQISKSKSKKGLLDDGIIQYYRRVSYELDQDFNDQELKSNITNSSIIATMLRVGLVRNHINYRRSYPGCSYRELFLVPR